ncbi:MAG: hypothetical protein WAK48_05410 [Candidatus Acidiferrum sp.]|jgi:hypothetical protein
MDSSNSNEAMCEIALDIGEGRGHRDDEAGAVLAGIVCPANTEFQLLPATWTTGICDDRCHRTDRLIEKNRS